MEHTRSGAHDLGADRRLVQAATKEPARGVDPAEIGRTASQNANILSQFALCKPLQILDRTFLAARRPIEVVN